MDQWWFKIVKGDILEQIYIGDTLVVLKTEELMS